MDEAEDFVRRFAAFWADPAPEKMPDILTADVVLIQPMSAPMHGLEAAQAEFRKLFAWLPDLRATIDDWGSTVRRCSSSFACRPASEDGCWNGR